jgi:hypothetical protein
MVLDITRRRIAFKTFNENAGERRRPAQIGCSTLRMRATIIATIFWQTRDDRVIPFGMERIAADVEAFHLGFANFDT